ncbi:MAG: hypothetical protein HC863_02410, partial [Myxococcales bacterium]|nr:hypothetical protein [Myxococcales bacterium]
MIRGTAINQDGASSSLSTPNGLAQEAVFRAALRDSGLTPADVDYVEAHGKFLDALDQNASVPHRSNTEIAPSAAVAP